MRNVLLIICLFLLISCKSTVKSSWDCPIQSGGSCNTIKDIDCGNNKDKTKNRKYLQQFKKFNQENSDSFSDLRSKEKISKVVFAPYIDKAGNKHDVSEVYYIEFNSEWKE